MWSLPYWIFKIYSHFFIDTLFSIAIYSFVTFVTKLDFLCLILCLQKLLTISPLFTTTYSNTAPNFCFHSYPHLVWLESPHPFIPVSIFIAGISLLTLRNFSGQTFYWTCPNDCFYTSVILKLKGIVNLLSRNSKKIYLTLKSDSHLPKKCVIWFTGTRLKMMKNAFYFILKALFVLKISKFLSWLFSHIVKTARLER